MNGSTKLAL